MRFDAQMLTTLDEQVGVISRAQLRELGATSAQIDAMVRRGHLVIVHRGVYLRSGVGCSPQQEALAAVLRCGPGARVTGMRVLGQLGVDHVPDDAPFLVLLPPGRRERYVDFPTARDLRPDRHHARIGPLPATTPARCLVEVATHTDEGTLLSLFDRLRWRGLTSTARVVDTARDLPSHRGARRLLRLFDAGAADQESPGERAFEAVMRQVEPPLEWQIWVGPDLRVDALWRDLGLVIEYQGAGTHEHERDRRADAERHERLRRLGYEVLTVDRHDLRDPAALRARLARARDARGRALGRVVAEHR
jgi:hypothetical protein